MKLLFKLLGFFIGLYCLRIGDISLLFFPLLIILLMNILKKIRVNKNIMILYYILILISIFFGLKYNDLFYTNLKSFETIRVIIFIYMAIFLKIKNNYIEEFLRGIKYTIFLNLVWATFELILWNLNGFALNDYIFRIVLKIETTHTWLNIRNGNIRVCGFSWDPLNLGILSSMGYFLYKNKYMKSYSLVILYFTGSRAGQLGLILTILCNYILKNKFKLEEIIKKYLIILMLCIFGIWIYTNKIQNISATGDLRRKAYYLSAVKSTLINNELGSFLFGGSPFYSGNILASNEILVKETYLNERMTTSNWKIESDWAHILTGRGWIGLISYFGLFIFSYFKIKEYNLQMSQMILLYFFAGIGYYYENSIFINILLIYVNQNYKFKLNKREVRYERNNISRRKWNETLSNNKSNIKTDKSNI